MVVYNFLELPSKNYNRKGGFPLDRTRAIHARFEIWTPVKTVNVVRYYPSCGYFRFDMKL